MSFFIPISVITVSFLILSIRISLSNGFTHSLTHGAAPYLRSRQLCSYSRISQHFMEPGGSLPC
jgi:hypothetical protein